VTEAQINKGSGTETQTDTGVMTQNVIGNRTERQMDKNNGTEKETVRETRQDEDININIVTDKYEFTRENKIIKCKSVYFVFSFHLTLF